ncbi:hypothetical protein SAMN04488063_2489 [Halopelagius inordinatus]|uniref:HVO-0234-like beta-propeller domain-containing protein n=1 Tax=Halopelagius inordinatus TaxID=553467 RepID=A0A1I2SZJ4_9EURY|nr:hypothetical protein [Halopelagius inordinatus]SFG58215.1 hypothetical protein SAMN04488063_2489 [Halopelagius inordinatus]
MTRPERREDGFVAFYRGYTKTWIHALATVALTAFGTLTTVHRFFAVVAIVAYLLPLVVQYARYASGETDRTADGAGSNGRVETDELSASGTDGGPASRTDAADATPSDPTSRAEVAETETADSETTTGTDSSSEPRWTAVDSPTGETLFDAAIAGDDAYAVGSDGVVVAGAGTDDWRVVLSDGPGAGANALRGIDAVPGGGVWVAGDGGAVGRLDPDTDRHVDYSAPDGDTSNVAAVAAAGEPGDETVLLADGSGRVRRGRYRDGELAWDDPTKPGSGSSIAAISLREDGSGYLCDTSDGVYATRDGGRTFESVGPVGADGTLTDVAATEPETCLVAADDGVIRRYDGTTWTPHRLGDDPLRALSASGNRAVACADGGTVYERSDSSDWTQVSTPTSASLRGVAVGDARAVGVGEEGSIVERLGRETDAA